MLRPWRHAFLSVLVVALTGAAGAAATPEPAAAVRVVVGYTNDGFAEAADIEARLGARRLATIEPLRADILELDAADTDRSLELFRVQPAVRYAARDALVHALRVPNDALLSSQWSLATTRAEEAWDLSTGSQAVVVAVLDTGVDPAQPDLRGKLVAGYDYVNGDGDPSDDNGHGTAVAGVVAATTDNQIGVAGYCWQCRVMPIKVLAADGSGFDSDLARGIVWATDQGARVINLSLGGPSEDLTLASAAQYAYAHGALVVAAAGNEGLSTLDYPAAIPSVLSVGASDRSDHLYAFSNSGAAVAAPGENSTTGRGGSYVTFLGTSSAAPVVSGIAGLAFGRNPALAADQVRQAIEAGARPISGVKHGRVDALATLRALGASPLAPPASPGPAATRPPAGSVAPDGGTAMRTARFAGRLTRAHRSRVFGLTTRSGVLQATLTLRNQVRVRLRLVAGGRLVASVRGNRVLRLRAPVRSRAYRLVVSAAGRRPVAFRLTVAYPPNR